ncbi:MAG: Xaa-Pro peptidase family protein [Microthrixaceae bacterium]
MSITENVAGAVSDLPAMDHVGRVDRLRDAMGDVGLDGLVVTNLTNVRYLCGFTGSAGVLLVTGNHVHFVTDGRYTEQSRSEVGSSGVPIEIEISASEPDRAIAARAKADGVSRLGLEENSITWADHTRWVKDLLPGTELLGSNSIVETLRLVKEPAEAARIRAACAVADEALARTRHLLNEGPTEIEFAMELDSTMKRLGAADVSFETIVASGPNGAKPHHHPGGRVIADGDLVVIDFGALVDGYHSDMTRTMWIGDVGKARERMFEIVLESQQAGMEAVIAGVEASAVDSMCRQVIDDAGWGDAFVHGTGHGVGLDIHEEPRVSSRSAAILEPGHVVTVEPGVYIPELGGVRIEDTVLVTDTGCDRLTRTPKTPQPG